MATVLAEDALASLTSAECARDRGAVFTPDFLADWAAGLLREHIDGETQPTIADFGCGSGKLLLAAVEHFGTSFPVGIEIDGPSAVIAQQLLGASAKIIVDDFLVPRSRGSMPAAAYWIDSLRTRPDALIMNPPWGAAHNLSKESALSSGLSLARGQFDTYELFCELALQILKPGGSYVFIIPDSIFLPEHEKLRRLLANRTTINLIARLGEGIFPGVYRGCAIIVGRLKEPYTGHRVECIRLTKSHRDSLQAGKTLRDCRRDAAHFVPQDRFRCDGHCRFDIDVTETDEAITRVLACGGDWTLPLDSRRGVELSKTGRVLLCTACGAARPEPKTLSAQCLQCGGALSNHAQVIVAERPGSAGVWRPFIAGEDVRRYSTECRRWIRSDLRGINYKRPHVAGLPRILVRKTGIGINAALDSSDAFTNQVVFEYTLRSECSFDFSYLHYALGVLCSRVLLAVHLKRGGELEWRSHPYVTQKTLAALPIPLPREDSRLWHQAAAIAAAVEAHLTGHHCDHQIEGLVGGLYGLTSKDMRWVAEVLFGAADLDAIRNLRLPVDRHIDPITVR